MYKRPILYILMVGLFVDCLTVSNLRWSQVFVANETLVKKTYVTSIMRIWLAGIRADGIQIWRWLILACHQ